LSANEDEKLLKVLSVRPTTKRLAAREKKLLLACRLILASYSVRPRIKKCKSVYNAKNYRVGLCTSH